MTTNSLPTVSKLLPFVLYFLPVLLCAPIQALSSQSSLLLTQSGIVIDAVVKTKHYIALPGQPNQHNALYKLCSVNALAGSYKHDCIELEATGGLNSRMYGLQSHNLPKPTMKIITSRDEICSYEAGSFYYQWLTSRALFDTYRKELPRRGQKLGQNGLYFYTRVSEGISWSVWAWVDSNNLLVGYLGMDKLWGWDLGNSAEISQLENACHFYVEHLQHKPPSGLGTSKRLEPFWDDKYLYPTCSYGARLNESKEVDVRWGARGDWCGGGLIDWWSIDWQFKPHPDDPTQQI